MPGTNGVQGNGWIGASQDGNYNNVQPIYWKIGVPHRLRAGAAGKTYSAEAVAVKATAW